MSRENEPANFHSNKSDESGSKSHRSKHKARKSKKKQLTFEEASTIDLVSSLQPDWDPTYVKEFCEKHNWNLENINLAIQKEFEYERPSHSANTEQWQEVTKKVKKPVSKDKFSGEHQNKNKEYNNNRRNKGKGFRNYNNTDEQNQKYRGKNNRGRNNRNGRGKNAQNDNMATNDTATDSTRQPLTEAQPRVPAMKHHEIPSAFIHKSFASIMAPKPVVKAPVAAPVEEKPVAPKKMTAAEMVKKSQQKPSAQKPPAVVAQAEAAPQQGRGSRPPRTSTRPQPVKDEVAGPSALLENSQVKDVAAPRARKGGEWRKKKNEKFVAKETSVDTKPDPKPSDAPSAKPHRAPMTKNTVPESSVIMPSSIVFDKHSAPSMQFGFHNHVKPTSTSTLSSSFNSKLTMSSDKPVSTAPVNTVQPTKAPIPASTQAPSNPPITSQPAVTNSPAPVVNNHIAAAPVSVNKTESSTKSTTANTATTNVAAPSNTAAPGQAFDGRMNGYPMGSQYMHAHMNMPNGSQQPQAYLAHPQMAPNFSGAHHAHSMPMDPAMASHENPAGYAPMDNYYDQSYRAGPQHMYNGRPNTDGHKNNNNRRNNNRNYRNGPQRKMDNANVNKNKNNGSEQTMPATNGRHAPNTVNNNKRGNYKGQQGFFNDKSYGAPAGFKKNAARNGSEQYPFSQQQSGQFQAPQSGYQNKSAPQSNFKQGSGAPSSQYKYGKQGATQPPQQQPGVAFHNQNQQYGMSMGYGNYFPPTHMYPYQYPPQNQYAPPGFGSPYGGRAAYAAPYNYAHGGAPFQGAPDGQFEYGYDPKMYSQGKYPAANQEQSGSSNAGSKSSTTDSSTGPSEEMSASSASSMNNGPAPSNAGKKSTNDWQQDRTNASEDQTNWDSNFGAHANSSYNAPYSLPNQEMNNGTGASTANGNANSAAPHAYTYVQQQPMMPQSYDYQSWGGN